MAAEISLQQLEELTQPQSEDLLLATEVTVTVRATDCVIGSAKGRLSSASAPFVRSDTGKFVTISGAGVGGADHIAVARYVSPSVIAVSPIAEQSVSGATVLFAQSKKLKWSTIIRAIGDATGRVEHAQEVPEAIWVIAHKFGRPPNVVLLDADGQVYLAAISHNAPLFTEVRITHDTGPEIGSAYLT